MHWPMRFFRKRKLKAEIDSELRFHIEQKTADLIAQGVEPAEARRRAMAKFGGVEAVKEDCRDALGARFFGTVVQDIRFGLRILRKSSGFTAVAILTLALGIGANTAIFSLIDAVMLRSLPVHDPQHLLLFEWRAQGWPEGDYSGYGDCAPRTYGSKPAMGCSLPLPVAKVLQTQTNVFSSVAAFASPGMQVKVHGQVLLDNNEPVVSGDFFTTLGVKAVLGRTLEPSDDTPSAAPAVVLSYAFWQSAFVGKRSVLGQTIFLNQIPFTIVGVAEPSFTNLSPGRTQDLWVPIAMVPRLYSDWGASIYNGVERWWLIVLGRLKPGVSRQQAEAAASVVFSNQVRQSGRLQARMTHPGILLTPAAEGLTGMRYLYSQELYIFMFAAGMILLIACANVAGLLVSRGSARQKEIALRLAIGAGRGRIARQLLTESAFLSLLGGLMGTVVAYWGVKAITPFIRRGVFPFVVSPDWRVLGFTVVVTVLSGIFFGLAPAVAGTSLDLTPALKENAPTQPTGAPRLRWLSLGHALVVTQVALGAVVLCGAGLLVRTLENLRAINPGFDPHNVLLLELDSVEKVTAHYWSTQEKLYARLRDRLAALPGVTSASYSSGVLLGGGRGRSSVHIQGQPGEPGRRVDLLAVGPHFLRTMRIPLLRGRSLNSEDFQLDLEKAQAYEEGAQEAARGVKSPAAWSSPVAKAPMPVLVNETFVRQYLAGANPLSAWMTLDCCGVGRARIVGVVANTKHDDLRSSFFPAVYFPFTGGPIGFELRTLRDPMALTSSVRQIVKQVDPNLYIFAIHTQTEQIDLILWQERMYAKLSSFFAVLALLLACIGLYGLLAYEVTRRRREIGIRLALGAQPRDVMRQIVRRAVVFVAVGTATGIAVSLAAARFLASLLYGVRPADPVTLAAVAFLLFLVAVAACWVPARRAMRVDPIAALRQE